MSCVTFRVFLAAGGLALGLAIGELAADDPENTAAAPVATITAEEQRDYTAAVLDFTEKQAAAVTSRDTVNRLFAALQKKCGGARNLARDPKGFPVCRGQLPAPDAGKGAARGDH